MISNDLNLPPEKPSLKQRILGSLYRFQNRLFNRLSNESHYHPKKITNEPTHEWMRPVSSAHHTTVKTSYKLMGYIIVLFSFIFIIWANFFEIDEYVHATGIIEAESDNKSISHYEGGIIEEIRIKEGQEVKKNEVLFVIKDESAKANYAEAKANYYKIWATILRLQSQIEKKDLVLPQEIRDNAPEIVQSSMSHYKNRMESVKNEEEIISDQLAQHQGALKTTQERIKSLGSLHTLSKEREMMLQKLVNQKLIAKSQFIQAQLETENRKMELETSKNNIAQLEASISEDKDKLEHVRFTYDTQDWQELKEQEIKFIEANKAISIGKDRSERSEVKSPVDGIVKEISEKTIGSAVLAGKVLVTIVPVNDNPIVEAHVLPSDIGFIRVGNPAVVKVSTYDYSIYGSLHGKVERVSADAIEDPKDPQKIFFKVKIRTDKNTIKYNEEIHKISPGMQAQVDIITAKRTVMHYIMKPVIKTLEAPLRER